MHSLSGLVTPKFLLWACVFCGVLLLLVFLAAWLFRPDPPAVPDLPEFDDPGLAVIPAEVSGTPFFAPQMTHEASESRRLRGEHASLLTSIPPTPTLSARAPDVQAVASDLREVAGADGGVPYRTEDLEDWHNPAEGIGFHREESGDFTPLLVGEAHPYRELFYYQHYPDGVPNFSDRSIYVPLGSALVKEAVELLPPLGQPTRSMVQAFASRVGWEIYSKEAPVVAVWSTFRLDRDGFVHTYAVGGVMELEVRSVRDEQSGEDLPYLVPGRWLGPVVLERLSLSGG